MQSYAVSYGDSETVFQKCKTVLGNEKIDPEDRSWFCAQRPKALPAGTSHRWCGPVASFQFARCDVGGSIPPAVMLLLPILPFHPKCSQGHLLGIYKFTICNVTFGTTGNNNTTFSTGGRTRQSGRSRRPCRSGRT